MDRLLKVFEDANRAARERMKRFDELLKSPKGKELIARCSKQKPNPAFVEAHRLSKERMERRIQCRHPQGKSFFRVS